MLAAHFSEPPGGVVLRRRVLRLAEVLDHLRFIQRFHHTQADAMSAVQLSVRLNRNGPATEPQQRSLVSGS